MNFQYTNVLRCVIFIFCFGYVQNRRKIKFTGSVDFSDRNSDIYLNSIQLISKYGYTPEIYTVITSDGYLVDVYRIPKRGPPVLLVHGIGDSSDSWLVLGPSQSLAYQLSDLGFDVWLFNARGNKYSKGHVKNLSGKAYWDFTYEEIATEDLPAVIDYILGATSYEKLSYVGFSQGTTIFLVMCSMRPKYNDKINKAVLLAPVAWINHINYPFTDFFAGNVQLFKAFLDSVGVFELFSDNALKNLYHAKVCQEGVPARVLCALEFYVSYGIKNIRNLYIEKLPVVASHIPAGVSTKTFVHYFQSYLSKDFRRFDYGAKMNLHVYSSAEAPAYDLSLVTAPVYVFNSESDWFSTSADVETLRSKLPNIVKSITHNKSLDFTHLEFIYGSRVNYLVNNNIKSILIDQI